MLNEQSIKTLREISFLSILNFYITFFILRADFCRKLSINFQTLCDYSRGIIVIIISLHSSIYTYKV